MTLPQIRQGIAMILHEAFQCGTMSHMLKECQMRLQRHALARLYHWKQHNRLPPLNLHKQQFDFLGKTVELLCYTIYARKPGATGWAIFLALRGVLVVGTAHALCPHSLTRQLRHTPFDRPKRTEHHPPRLATKQADQEAHTLRGQQTISPLS